MNRWCHRFLKPALHDVSDNQCGTTVRALICAALSYLTIGPVLWIRLIVDKLALTLFSGLNFVRAEMEVDITTCLIVFIFCECSFRLRKREKPRHCWEESGLRRHHKWLFWGWLSESILQCWQQLQSNRCSGVKSDRAKWRPSAECVRDHSILYRIRTKSSWRHPSVPELVKGLGFWIGNDQWTQPYWIWQLPL